MSPAVEDAVEATRTDTGDMAPEATRRLLDSLPQLSRQSCVALAAAAVGVPIASMVLTAVQGEGAKGKSGAIIHMISDSQGHKLGTLKVVPGDLHTMVREADGMIYLNRLALPNVRAPKVLALGLTEVDGKQAGVIAMEVAPGQPLDDLMLAVRDAPDATSRQHALEALQEATAASARALAELHTRAPGSGERVPTAFLNRYHEKQDENLKVLDAHADEVETMGIDLHGLKDAANEAWRAALEHPGTSSVVHGDDHVGNIVVDPREGVSLIDFNRLHHSLDSRGHANGSAARDISKFWYRFQLFAQEFGYSQQEIALVQKSFDRAYSEQGAVVTAQTLHFFTLTAAIEGLANTFKQDPPEVRARMAHFHADNIRDIMAGNSPQVRLTED